MPNKILKEALEKLFDSDQRDRKEYRENKIDTIKLQKRDEERAIIFKSIVSKFNVWPKKSEVGEKALAGAFVMAQHSDNTIFQKRCLELMKKVPATEQNKKYIAYLTDRILIQDGKPQLYGTQFKILNDGTQEIHSIDDISNLEVRRKEMGLD